MRRWGCSGSSRSRWSSSASPGRRVAPALDGQAGTAALVALFFAWAGGLATLLGAVYPQIRAWNRLSIFIGFFALLGVGLLLDRGLARLGSRLLAGIAVCLVLVIGILDQTNGASIPRYGTVAAEWRNDDGFVRAIDARLPEGASVLQLPYVPFPETPPLNGMVDYDELRGYLHSDDLRWSYGALRGRDDPNAALGAEPVPALVRDAAAAGFAGIYVDRFGYADKAAALEGELATAIGTKPLVSENGRLAFFQLP